MKKSKYRRMMDEMLEQQPAPQDQEDEKESDPKYDPSVDPDEPATVQVKFPLAKKVAQAFDVEIEEAYPEVDTRALAHGGNIGAMNRRRYTEPVEKELTQDDIDVLDKNQKAILAFASKAFLEYPYGTALTALERWLEQKYDINPGKSNTIAGVVANMLKKDVDPQSYIFQKVAPMINRQRTGVFQ